MGFWLAIGRLSPYALESNGGAEIRTGAVPKTQLRRRIE